jgi:fatty-acid desaturase
MNYFKRKINNAQSNEPSNTLEEIKLEKIQQKLFFLERVRWLIHFITLAGIILIGISWVNFIILLISYYLGMLIVSISSHRYFSHKSFKQAEFFNFYWVG